MDKTVLIEQTSKKLKRWELIVTIMLFLTLFAGLGLLYVAIPLGITFFCLSGMCFLASLQSGLPFGGITDKFTATALDTFDEICIFVQSSPCNMEFVVYIYIIL